MPSFRPKKAIAARYGSRCTAFVDVSAARPIPSSEELLFRDGLGDRLLVRDTQGRPVQEALVLRPELSGVPSFEFALNERLWLVERFDHPAFLTVRNILRVPGRLPQISLITDHTGGERLSDMLARGASTGQHLSTGAALFVIKEILDGLSELHRQSGDLSHGAIAPERIVIAEGKVRIADYVLGSAIEQLRFSSERYWRELRVAVPASAGGARLDRRVDVAQVGMIAVALFAGRPLRDAEHIGALAELLMGLPLPSPLRTWLMKTLHMDPRRLFVSASEASQSLHEVMVETGLRTAAHDLQLQSVTAPRVQSPVMVKTSPAVEKQVTPPPASKPPVPAAKPPAAAAKPARDVWQAHDVEPRGYAPRGGITTVNTRRPMDPRFKKYLVIAVLAVLMTGVFTAAQFIPAPDWLFSRTGTLVIESNPQGVPVLVNGNPQGVTPLTLEVEGGRHEVELRGPGKPKIFNVFVSRGDRVAQYVEFPSRLRR
jgi:hypothetical protein